MCSTVQPTSDVIVVVREVHTGSKVCIKTELLTKSHQIAFATESTNILKNHVARPGATRLWIEGCNSLGHQAPDGQPT